LIENLFVGVPLSVGVDGLEEFLDVFVLLTCPQNMDDSDPSRSAVAAAKGLSETFSLQMQTSVQNLATLLDELLQKQQSLIGYLEKVNGQLGADETIQKVHLTMLHTHQYHKKLVQIRKDIVDIHGKASKLKARAQKLYVKQEEEARLRQRTVQLQEERERSLIAKPAKDLPQN